MREGDGVFFMDYGTHTTILVDSGRRVDGDYLEEEEEEEEKSGGIDNVAHSKCW